jgi:hypothetical protein
LFTMNLFPLTLLSTLTFTVMFWGAWEKMCDKKRLELWRNHNWLIHHNNAPAHTSLKTTGFVINNMVIIPHPTYAGLSLLWFRFPKLKIKPKWWCFETVSDIQRKLQAVLNSIKENDFHGVFEAWKKDGFAV